MKPAPVRFGTLLQQLLTLLQAYLNLFGVSSVRLRVRGLLVLTHGPKALAAHDRSRTVRAGEIGQISGGDGGDPFPLWPPQRHSVPNKAPCAAGRPLRTCTRLLVPVLLERDPGGDHIRASGSLPRLTRHVDRPVALIHEHHARLVGAATRRPAASKGMVIARSPSLIRCAAAPVI